MKNKIWSLILVLVVAVCGIVFVACGGQTPGANVSLSVSSGLDSELNSGTLLNLSNELSLSENEKVSLGSGLGYDKKISTGKVVTLIVGSANFASREIIIQINGYEDGMGQLISFSSDSSNLSFSNVEYLSGGRAKVVITGLNAGTAEVTATSGQYSKQTTFTVKVLELPSSFAVKTGAVIYLEKNSILTIKAEDYINFYPSTTNMKDLEFYNGTTLLTVNGVTTLTAVLGQANAITDDTNLTIKSTRMQEEDNVQSITVKVVDEISNVGLKKMVYTENGSSATEGYQTIGETETLTVIKNSSKVVGDKTISYGIRDVYVIVRNVETDLTINSKVTVNGQSTDIVCLPVDHELITENNKLSSNYGGLIDDYIDELLTYSIHVFKFQFQYIGYDSYKVEFSFGVENYIYSEREELIVDFRSASNLVEFRKSTESTESTSYTIYDGYSGVYGTRFVAKTNIGTLAYKSFQLVFDEEAKNNLSFRTTLEQEKAIANPAADTYTISLTNGENFYIKGNKDSADKTYTITIRVVYEHDGIIFETSKTVEISVQKAPDSLKFTIDGNEISSYNFDLNTSGKRIGANGSPETNSATSTLSLYIRTYDSSGALIGAATDFSISNSSANISVTREGDTSKIIITAKAVGTGSFSVVLGNNIKKTFTFEVIQSISQFGIELPDESQNSNVFSLKNDYTYDGAPYNNYLIALTGKPIPVLITKNGNVEAVSITCTNGATSYVTYSNGYLKTTTDFENAVANVNVTYEYINENNEIKSATVVVDQILITSITTISNFSLTTSKGSTNFNLYDQSSVGYYAKDLSTTTVYVDILPTNLKSEFLEQIDWVTNVNSTITELASTLIITTDIFVFTYYKATGTATITCNISKSNYSKYYDTDGKFTGGTIVLTAKIDRGDYGIYTKSLQFNVIKSEQVDVITTNVSEISLDEYSNTFDLFVNIFPSAAVNKKLRYLTESDVKIELTSSGYKITLSNNEKSGSGILRIIAEDSYTSSTDYTKWVDVKINVSDGSAANPYTINSAEDVAKMIDTNFAKHYLISGVIDLSKSGWVFSEHTLSGSITGVNNAELKGITITNTGETQLGLFAEITGTIKNIKISGTIDADFRNQDFTNPVCIGLLAGENSGMIENVYVELNGGKIVASSEYKLIIGGVVGLNEGTMQTTISSDSTYTRMVKFTNEFSFIDESNSAETHTLYIGGVAGENNGMISRIMTEKLTDFNNGYVTAEVYIKAYYKTYENIQPSENEAIGGICGISSASLLGVSAYGEIMAGTLDDSAFSGHFNNIGGLVGINEGTVDKKEFEIDDGEPDEDNEIITTNPETQVYVRGRNYVGGAFGVNKGNVANLRIEAVETTLENGNYREGLNASFVIGENYVGGIAGEHNSKSITSSYFISYLTRTFVTLNDTSTESYYFGDIVVIETSNITASFGILFGQQNSIATIDYLVGIGNIQFISTDPNYNFEQNVSEVTGTNYAIYCEFIDQNTDTTPINKDEGLAESKTKEELQQTEGFAFIYLPPTGIGLDLPDENKNQMKKIETPSSPEDDNLAFYLFYYESSNSNATNAILNKNLNIVSISDYINIESLSKCSFAISNPLILEIDNGNFKIKGTGLVTITATTPYNIELEEVFYIYIVNYTDNLSAYLSSTKNKEEIKSGDKVEFDATESVMIYFSFVNKYNNQKGGYNLTLPVDIKVLAKVDILKDGELETHIVKAGTGVNPETGFGLIRISEDAYQFVVNNKIISTFTSITFIPYIEETFGGKTYTTYLVGESLTTQISQIIKITETGAVEDKIGLTSNLSLKKEVDFEYKLANVTKSVSLSKESITTEPYYETSLEVLLNSLNQDETLTIKIAMIDPATGLTDTSFIKDWIKIVAKYGNSTVENGTKNSRRDVFSISGINAETNNKITVAFRFEDGYRAFTENRVFVVTFTTSNYKTAQLTLTFEPQKAITINSTLYDVATVSDNQYNFTGAFSYIPSSFMIPGQISLLEFNIIPNYTNYAYIEILNLSSNESTLLFDLFNRTSETGIIGADQIDGGIRIPKSLIDNGKFYLRSFLSESISDNTTISIKIVLKDENKKVIPGSEQTKLFYVQHLPGVRLTIDGVNSGNTANSRLSLARGLSYDLSVWVKGYSSGNLIRNGNVYTDGELVFEISENPDLISIVKNADGTYKLVVKGNAITDRTVLITTYGERVTEEGITRSRDAKIYLNIEEFVVKSPQGSNDIVKDVISNIYPSAIGNSYTFEISLNNDILKYDPTNADIVRKVTEFLTSLSTGVVYDSDREKTEIAVWSYQDLSKTSTTWAKVVSANTSFKSTNLPNILQYKTANGTFTFQLDTTTGSFSVTFNKTESSNSPTFRFKFNATYYYLNGVPTLKTGSLDSDINTFDLKQEFTFDIYEKTDLRNPYPIYSYEELIDMREGNYYILLKDITLPADFKPITTKIGGLDGNNHRITVPNIDILSTKDYESLQFGLFAETISSTLLENIILYINGTITINTHNFSTVTYGLLVGVNRGQITNCAIEGKNYPRVELNLFGLSTSSTVNNEAGALVGINYGNITHSRVEVGISINGSTLSKSKMPSNLGGITSVNKSGATIASSYVNALVENNTGSTIVKTGGVVSVNEMNARIFTTYITGNYTSIYSPYADNGTIIVYSGASAGAFVYENSGTISNCYANIKMKTVSVSSGFVYQNKKSGVISYCYSTSLVDESAGNSAFIGRLSATVGEITILNEGTFEECYALESTEKCYKLTEAFTTPDETYPIGTIFEYGDTNFYNTDLNGIGTFKEAVSADEIKLNYGIGTNSGFKATEGLTILTYDEFKYDEFKKESNFSAFAFSQTADVDAGVWFWPSTSGAESSFMRNGLYMTFKSDRPELVSPNTVGAGSKTFNYSEYNEETGITKYYYNEDSAYKKGTKYNPYIIATTDDVEYMKEDAVNFVISTHYYRIVCDLIYKTSTISSGLYKYSFLGNIEGNGFTVGNYVLDSAEVLDSSGFFATLGTQSSQRGSIKNVIFAPRYISLTNANCVGAVAGKAYSTTLVNILVDGFTYSSSTTGVVILGRNCIGGVVGVAYGNYNFNEISAKISVNSTYRASLNSSSVKYYTDGDYKKVSYAGVIAGALDGYGKLIHIDVFGDVVSIAENAGLMFGYVGKNVEAQILNVTSSSKQYIKADVYAGVIAAHNDGTLIDVKVIDTNSRNSFFVTDNYIPVAVGNIVGYMTAGKIKDATATTDLKVPTGIKYVGGAVGLMKAGTLEKVLIEGEISGGSTIGGLVGQIYNVTTISNWKVTIIDSYHNGNITSTSSDATVRIGTIIGYVNVTEDKIALGTAVLSNGVYTYTNSNSVNILLSTEFTDKTYTTKTVTINNYVYSTGLQIWAGTIICASSNTSERGAVYTSPNTSDLEEIYSPTTNHTVAMAKTYLFNGEEYEEGKLKNS